MARKLIDEELLELRSFPFMPLNRADVRPSSATRRTASIALSQFGLYSANSNLYFLSLPLSLLTNVVRIIIVSLSLGRGLVEFFLVKSRITSFTLEYNSYNF
jgi:hypothetical protein